MWTWGPLCSCWGVGRRASRKGVYCVPVFWEKDSAHSCAQGVNAKQTCLTHASPSAVMALLSKILPRTLLTLSTHIALCLSAFAHFHCVHWSKAAAPITGFEALWLRGEAQPHGQIQDGFLINTEPCGGCSIVCQDRQGCLSLPWFNVDCSSAQCPRTYRHPVAQVYAMYTHCLPFSLGSVFLYLCVSHFGLKTSSVMSSSTQQPFFLSHVT